MKRWIAIGILVALCLVVSLTLWDTSSELGSTRATLASTQTELALTQAELTSYQAELASTQADLASTQITLEATLISLDSTKAELSSLQAEYDRLASGYVVKDPTYEEMKDFIAKDKTDRKEYIEGRYTCVNFAADVKKNAMEENTRCAFVIIEFPKGSHAIVAFDTTDKGLIYIEPQDDQEVKLRKRYNDYIIERVIIVW
jgi:hypothetical protein